MSTLSELRKLHKQLAAIIAELEHTQEEAEAGPLRVLDKAKFFACYREKFGGLKQAQVAPLEFLLDKLVDDPPAGAQEAAYILATVKRECNDTYRPVREAYWLSEAWRKKHLRYWPWYGRGFVQLTWEENYRTAGQKLGLDLTTDPDAVMDPEISWKVLLRGMQGGWFTGKKLADYISGGKADYVEARRIVNPGEDSSIAKRMAEHARSFETCLTAAGYV